MARNHLKGTIDDRINLLMAVAAWNIWLKVSIDKNKQMENLRSKLVSFPMTISGSNPNPIDS